jgi:rSAM/selenodomain-associated transferase 2
MRISVVIPVINEKEDLPRTLRALAEFSDLYEVIIVDGGSTDGTREYLSDRLPAHARVIDGPRGRGNQLNAGAHAATGDVVLFLHADTRLPANAVQQITEALSEEKVAGGGFCVRFREDEPWTLRVVTAGINLRTRLFRSPTGDQAIFSRGAAFAAAGGFAQWPIFEDVDFVHRLKRVGRFVVIRSRVTTSARRYVTRGVLRTVLLMYALRVGFWLGVSPFRLHRWFRDVRPHLLQDRKCASLQMEKRESARERVRP